MLTQSAATTQKVVIVNGNQELMQLSETVLAAGHYNIVFAESSEHAYSHIKREQPNLVILFIRMENASDFRVLSMLKLDPDTESIPVLTYIATHEGDDRDDGVPDADAPGVFAAKPAVGMN